MTGEDYDHLVHVVRVRQGESIKVIFGFGHSSTGIVATIGKKELVLELTSKSFEPRAFVRKVFVGSVKKEAMADILRLGAELSITEIYFIETMYSQRLNFRLNGGEKILKAP